MGPGPIPSSHIRVVIHRWFTRTAHRGTAVTGPGAPAVIYTRTIFRWSAGSPMVLDLITRAPGRYDSTLTLFACGQNQQQCAACIDEAARIPLQLLKSIDRIGGCFPLSSLEPTEPAIYSYEQEGGAPEQQGGAPGQAEFELYPFYPAEQDPKFAHKGWPAGYLTTLPDARAAIVLHEGT